MRREGYGQSCGGRDARGYEALRAADSRRGNFIAPRGDFAGGDYEKTGAVRSEHEPRLPPRNAAQSSRTRDFQIAGRHSARIPRIFNVAEFYRGAHAEDQFCGRRGRHERFQTGLLRKAGVSGTVASAVQAGACGRLRTGV